MLDGYYSKFYENKIDLFWKFHSANKSEGFFNEDLKYIITRMLNVNPSYRPSAQELLKSKWLSPIQLKKTKCFSAWAELKKNWKTDYKSKNKSKYCNNKFNLN